MKDDSRGARRAPQGWALLALAVVIQAATPGWSEDRASCGTCAGSRKVRCTTCDGRGEIYAVCDICKGSGRKPCTVCAETEEGRSATPGRIPCALCRGRGTREATGRVCSRCRGRQSTSCSTCLGKGTVRCVKEKYERICPDCRFTGKVDCPSCSGENGPRASEGVEVSGDGLDQVESVATTANTGRSTLPPELDARHRKLTALHGSHMDIFAVDASRKAEAWKTEAARLERKIEEGGQSAESLEKFQSRVTHFRLRYGELRDVFLEAYRAYKIVGSIWKSRDRALESAPPSKRDEIAREQDERFEIVLRIAEEKAAKLEAESPSWLLKEVEDLTAMHTELEASAKATLALIEEEKVKGEEARRAARDAERQRRAAETRTVAGKRRASQDSAQVAEPEEEEDTAERRPARTRAGNEDREDEDASSAAVQGASGGSSAAILSALACAAGGFAAGAAVILVRKGKRSRETAPTGPQPAARR